MIRWTAVCGAIVLAACGGGSTPGGGGGTVNGTVGNVSLGNIVEAASIVYNGPECQNSSNQQASVYVFLSTTGGHCAAMQAGSQQPAGNVLVLGVNASGSTAPAPIAPGTYNVVLLGNPSAFGLAGTISSAGCESAGYISASGTVTLTTVSSSSVAGSYNITFIDNGGNTAGTLSGSFDAATCNVDASKVCSGTHLSAC